MTELIKITESNGRKAVSARELHRFLESKQQFGDWIKNRIHEYGFVENQDFEVFHNSMKNPKGGRPLKEYILSVDMAKELSMVEGNAKGKQARKYFIDIERSYRSISKSLPNDIEERLRLLEAKSITTEVTELTVFGFANMQRKKLYGSEAMTIGKRAAKRCRELRLPVNKVIDQRFGWVNTYPDQVLKEVFEDFFMNPRF